MLPDRCGKPFHRAIFLGQERLESLFTLFLAPHTVNLVLKIEHGAKNEFSPHPCMWFFLMAPFRIFRFSQLLARNFFGSEALCRWAAASLRGKSPTLKVVTLTLRSAATAPGPNEQRPFPREERDGLHKLIQPCRAARRFPATRDTFAVRVVMMRHFFVFERRELSRGGGRKFSAVLRF